MVKVMGMFPDRFTNGGGAANEINGKDSCGVLVGDVLKIEAECYLGITVDTRERRVLMIFTAYGGMDIEELARTFPEKLVSLDCTLVDNPVSDTGTHMGFDQVNRVMNRFFSRLVFLHI